MKILRGGSGVFLLVVLLLSRGVPGAPILYAISPFSSLTSDTSRLYRLDTNTAAATFVGSTGKINILGIARDHSGRLLGVDNAGELLQFNPTTGAATVLVDFPQPFFEGDVAVDPVANILHVFSFGKLYRLDLNTNTIDAGHTPTFLGSPIGTGWNFDGLAFRGNDLYGLVTVQTPSLNGHLVRIDHNTFEISDVGPLGVDFGATGGLAYDPASDVFYAAGRPAPGLYRVNPLTGSATSVGNHGLIDIAGLVFIPEPAGGGIMLCATTAILRRRRRNRCLPSLLAKARSARYDVPRDGTARTSTVWISTALAFRRRDASPAGGHGGVRGGVRRPAHHAARASAFAR